MRRAHPGLDGAERMLHRLAADTHHFGRVIQPPLHGFEHGLMLPAGHSPPRARGALILERTLLTVRTPITMQSQPRARWLSSARSGVVRWGNGIRCSSHRK